MRGDIVFRVYGVHGARKEDVYFGAYRTDAAAKAAIEALKARTGPEGWPDRQHDKGFVVREFAVDTDFEVPPLPAPRDRYYIRTTPKKHGPGHWDTTVVEVFRREGGNSIATFERNYPMIQTFEPFRQGDKEFALISRNYTTTAVLDLASGTVVAEERDNTGAGFCPVGFYVPDWWDVHDGSIIPGSEYWNSDKEWPTGQFGFVWGCYWGDDNSWKVQYLDLSRIREGIIKREERFGYLALATTGHTSPVFEPEQRRDRSPAPGFIEVSMYEGVPQVKFAVELEFNLKTGRLNEEQRLHLSGGASKGTHP